MPRTKPKEARKSQRLQQRRVENRRRLRQLKAEGVTPATPTAPPAS